MGEYDKFIEQSSNNSITMALFSIANEIAELNKTLKERSKD